MFKKVSISLALIALLLVDEGCAGVDRISISKILPENHLDISAEVVAKTDKTTPTKSDSLVFLQSVFRHGDRSPTLTFKSDKNQEDSWAQGWGELSPKGMEQLYVLGQKFQTKYIKNDKFIDPTYKSHEIFVKSSDYNRTIISAISKFIGFYSNTQPGVDYPAIKGWPAGYMPIPIHSHIAIPDNHFFNVDAKCPRRDKLYRLLQDTPEYIKAKQDSQEFLNKLSNWTDMTITLDILWQIKDVLFIEDAYKKELPEWATPEVLKQISDFCLIANKLYYGEGLQPLNGVDFKEIKVIRGGSMLNLILRNMKQKINCIKANGIEENTTEPKKECAWINRLKYFAISAHDTTLAALSCSLGAEPDNWFGVIKELKYSIAVTFELWQSRETNEYYVKLLLWPPQNKSYIDITQKIVGCEDNCSFEQFEKRSQEFIPKIPIEELCLNENLAPDIDNKTEKGNYSSNELRNQSSNII